VEAGDMTDREMELIKEYCVRSVRNLVIKDEIALEMSFSVTTPMLIRAWIGLQLNYLDPNHELPPHIEEGKEP
jgi:hypothetical protein